MDAKGRPGGPGPSRTAARRDMPKPTVAELGVDPAAAQWRRSGEGADAVEVAFVPARGAEGETWVLVRVAGDPDGRILVYDAFEWECFLDGVRGGEFDDGGAG